MCALRILLAEHHLELRIRLRILLTESRPDVVVWDDVHDGADLVEKARKLRPDLIVTEFSLPVINGIEAAELIHQTDPDLPILLISLHHSTEWLARVKAAGLSGHVLKTHVAEQLLQAIQIICDGGTFFRAPD